MNEIEAENEKKNIIAILFHETKVGFIKLVLPFISYFIACPQCRSAVVLLAFLYYSRFYSYFIPQNFFRIPFRTQCRIRAKLIFFLAFFPFERAQDSISMAFRPTAVTTTAEKQLTHHVFCDSLSLSFLCEPILRARSTNRTRINFYCFRITACHVQYKKHGHHEMSN